MRSRSIVLGIAALAMAGSLAACGQAGSSGGGTGSNGTATTKAGCAPVAGNDLVVLDDDKKLQNSDNVIPAINTKAATPPALTAALDKVSAALDSKTLIALNKQVDIDRQTSAVAASGFIAAQKLSDGLQKGSGTVVIGAANFSESHAGQHLRRCAQVGRLHLLGEDHRQPRALPAGVGKGRDPGGSGIRRHPHRVHEPRQGQAAGDAGY